jgi:hypothetical protein
MKQLSVKGLADYMTSSAAGQRNLIKQYKYPGEDEARAKILYYREARDRIVAFHRTARNAQWLTSQAANLLGIASLTSGKTRTRLRHNARALVAYGNYFSNKNFTVLEELPLSIIYGDVRVTAYPDLHVNEGNQEKLIKLDFSKEALPNEARRIICQVFLEASTQAGMNFLGKNILLFDVTRGEEYKLARVGSRMRTNIEAACKTISAIWDTI